MTQYSVLAWRYGSVGTQALCSKVIRPVRVVSCVTERLKGSCQPPRCSHYLQLSPRELGVSVPEQGWMRGEIWCEWLAGPPIVIPSRESTPCDIQFRRASFHFHGHGCLLCVNCRLAIVAPVCAEAALIVHPFWPDATGHGYPWHRGLMGTGIRNDNGR